MAAIPTPASILNAPMTRSAKVTTAAHAQLQVLLVSAYAWVMTRIRTLFVHSLSDDKNIGRGGYCKSSDGDGA